MVSQGSADRLLFEFCSRLLYDLYGGKLDVVSSWLLLESVHLTILVSLLITQAPFDRLRTKLMNQPTNQKVYNGLGDCFVKTVQTEGPMSLWRGFIPIWARFAPMATLQLLTIEFLYGTFGFKTI